MAHRIEEEWNAKLASAHNQHLEDLECIINDLNKRHSDKITRVKCELETSHREEIARLRLETKTSLEMSALEESRPEILSSPGAVEIARVQSEANSSRLLRAAVS